MSFKSLPITVRLPLIGLGTLIAYLAVGNLLHLAVFAADPPDPTTYPIAGDLFGSKAQGFYQEVTAVDADDWVHTRLTVAPHSPGPPLHFHKDFDEHIFVESGTLSVELEGGIVTVGPGEDLRVLTGVAHRPFNPTDEPVVIAGPHRAIPQSFAACLVQLYAALDDAGPPAILLQMSVIDPICDTHLADVPAAGVVALRAALGPAARLLGYRSYDPAKSLHPER